MKIKCDDIKIGNRIRKDLGDVDSLAASIEELGLLQPIGITKDNELIFGERRLAACKQLDYEEVETVVVDSDELLECEVSENVNRTSFNMSERVAIRKLFKEKEIEKRGKMMAKGIKIKKSDPNLGSKKLYARLAKLSGVSRATADKENYIVSHGDQQLIDKIDNNELSVNKAYNLVKKLKKENEVYLNNEEVYLNNENQENEVYLNKSEENLGEKGDPGIPQFFNIERSVKLTKSFDDKIVKQADELGMSVSSLIRSVLEQYFK